MSDSSRIPIQQLDELTIDQIAAGEVVERPAQVVKELVENSIDSGSKKIRIEIVGGGFSRISVIDDGHGIPKEELKLAIKRHATSKISSSEDLRTVVTKGFRGEALASIAAVSKMTLSSKVRGSEGFSLTVDNGLIEDIQLIGIPPGTKVDVENLFQKIPARLSFQRRPSTENAAIVDIAISLALSESKVGILVEIDGRKVLDCPPCDSMEDRLYDLFGTTSSKLIPLESSEVDKDAPGKENWNGWISPPGISRSRSDDIHVLVNGRPVNPGPFLQSIRRGYHTRLMVGRHPIGVLSLNLPTEEVDVNVHPRKSEVSLIDRKKINSFLIKKIRDRLENAGLINSGIYEKKLINNFSSQENKQNTEPINFISNNNLDITDENNTQIKKNIENNHSHAQHRLGYAVGQINNMFIIAQTKNKIVIVDQHAAHERIVLEKLKSSFLENNIDRQVLLIPEILELEGDIQIFLDNKEKIEKLGIVFEEYSEKTILVRELPGILGKIKAKELFKDLYVQLEKFDEVNLNNYQIESLFSSIACHNSIRAGRKMNIEEMNNLLRLMETTPNSGQCNHGRPTFIELNIKDMEKLFGRN